MVSTLLLLTAWYVRWRSARDGGGRSALDLPAVAFLGAAALATFFSVDPFLSFVPSNRTGEGFLVYIGYVAALIAVARLPRARRYFLLSVIVGAGAIVAAIALSQYFGFDVLYRLGFRAFTQAAFYNLPGVRESGPMSVLFGFRANSTSGNPIFLGGYTALLLPPALALAVQARGWAAWGHGLAAVALFGALVASQTRAAWIAAAVAGTILAATLPRSRQVRLRLAVLSAAMLVLLAIMVGVREQALLAQRAVSLGFVDGSLQQKLYVWKHTLPLIAQRLLLGWGFSTLLGRFPDIGSPEYLKLFGFQLAGIDTPHNGVLHLAYSIGLLGLGAFLWLCVVFLRSLRDSLRAVTPAALRLDGALLAALVGYLVWWQSAWTQVGPAHIFWVFGGLAVALGREARGAPV